MKRKLIRFTLALLLVISTFVAVKLWTKSYETKPDPNAFFEVEGVRLEKDKDFVWLEIHLTKSGKYDHDLKKPVRLITADGVEHEPADTTFAGSPEKGFTEIWFKFWLEKDQLKGSLDLKLNKGNLAIKRSEPVPSFGNQNEIVLKSANWEKSWLGF